MDIKIVSGQLVYPHKDRFVLPMGQEIITKTDNYTMLDIETTGLYPGKNHITEIGAAKVRNGEVVDTYETLINDPLITSIPPFIQNLNGITIDKLRSEGKDPFRAIMEFRTFVGDDLLAGYNVHFDLNFLATFFDEHDILPLTNDYFDVLRLARAHFKGQKNSLLNVMQRINLKNTEAHRGLSDTLDTINVYKWLLGEMNDEEFEFAQSMIKDFDLQTAIPKEANFRNPVAGKSVLVSAKLQAKTPDLAEALTKLGATLVDEGKADLVLVTNQEFSNYKRPESPAKLWSEGFLVQRLDDWARS
ncbi:MAG: 3'-5' exonuclease [Lactobacillus sp.]|nr:3'-5' exonuclease [Lactobacillus sp.]